MNKICKSVKTYQVFQHLWNCIEERKKRSRNNAQNGNCQKFPDLFKIHTQIYVERCGSLSNTPKKCWFNLQNPWMCKFTWQKGFCRSAWIKNFNMWRLFCITWGVTQCNPKGLYKRELRGPKYWQCKKNWNESLWK